MISLITPTADRPVAFALAERFVARQTVIADEWIVADGGQVPAVCTMGQIHVHNPRPPGAANFAHNLLAGITRARGDAVIFADDDDWYAPTHVETLCAALESNRHALIAGCSPQHYYHVGARVWRTMPNVNHSSLCQTAIRSGASEIFQAIVEQSLAAGKFYVDVDLWRSIARAQWVRVEQTTCVGIKGLPGQAGLGIGHRPAGNGWHPDPELVKLREWIGEDAEIYAGFDQRPPANGGAGSRIPGILDSATTGNSTTTPTR